MLRSPGQDLEQLREVAREARKGGGGGFRV